MVLLWSVQRQKNKFIWSLLLLSESKMKRCGGSLIKGKRLEDTETCQGANT